MVNESLKKNLLPLIRLPLTYILTVGSNCTDIMPALLPDRTVALGSTLSDEGMVCMCIWIYSGGKNIVLSTGAAVTLVLSQHWVFGYYYNTGCHNTGVTTTLASPITVSW